jgi:hypothetical protein
MVLVLPPESPVWEVAGGGRNRLQLEELKKAPCLVSGSRGHARRVPLKKCSIRNFSKVLAGSFCRF